MNVIGKEAGSAEGKAEIFEDTCTCVYACAFVCEKGETQNTICSAMIRYRWLASHAWK